MTIDVIIPTYRPGEELAQLVEKLAAQSLRVSRILLVNTQEAFFPKISFGDAPVQVLHISKEDFDHGGTRRMAAATSKADVLVFMTQDACPADEYLLENLCEQLKDSAGGTGSVAAAYARQLPKEDCKEVERYTRKFNYPAESVVKSKADLERLGIKTYFCSNVCAAYRRDVYEALGGFVERTIFNEDMIFAGALIGAGYKIAYEANACVYHSHNYTCMQQLHRNFDLGVSQAQHPEVFKDVPSAKEGTKLVKETTKHFAKEKKFLKLLYFYIQCAFKYAGYLLGKHYAHLPKGLVKTLSDNKTYWRD